MLVISGICICKPKVSKKNRAGISTTKALPARDDNTFMPVIIKQCLVIIGYDFSTIDCYCIFLYSKDNFPDAGRSDVDRIFISN